MVKHDVITKALGFIFQGIDTLKAAFPNRKFTIDGRLVGDIGEIIAALEYDVILDDVAQADHDGRTTDGRRVQIKATFKEQLTFKTVRTITWDSSSTQIAPTTKFTMAQAVSSVIAMHIERTLESNCCRFRYLI